MHKTARNCGCINVRRLLLVDRVAAVVRYQPSHARRSSRLFSRLRLSFFVVGLMTLSFD